MRKISKIESKIPQMPSRKKVAAYARVSKDTERLAHSLSAQVSYYSDLIQKTPGWEYAGVYADYGISATSAAGRDEFLRMLADCETGKIDIVLTKSISRFARNTVDLLETVRHLKDLGIEVRFEKERIHSLSEDGELMLALLASFAQEESRSISENSKWGIRKRFESGEIGTANKHLLGYRYDEEQRKYIIIPEEAVIIRRMFDLYIKGVSLRDICDDLNSIGYRTVNGCLFQEASLSKLVQNEVYAGDIRRQKSYTADPITKNKVKNRGEFPQFYMPDYHEAIIDRETYAKVLAEIDRRAALLNPTYCFTGRVKCGTCGSSYTRKKSKVRGRTFVHWICRAKKDVGKGCESVNFSESELKHICKRVLELDEFSEEIFEQRVLQMLVLPGGDVEFRMTGGEVKVWKNLLPNGQGHIPTLTDCFFGKIVCGICNETYHRVNSANRHVFWYCMTKKRKGKTCDAPNYPDYHLRRISAWVLGLDEFDEKVFDTQVEKIIVQPNKDLLYRFYDGREILWQR